MSHKQGKGNTQHGMRRTPTYVSWYGMLSRCRNRNGSHYDYYGGKGVKVCERWLLFENFYADMGIRPVGSSLDRINGDGNYEPGNCRWATSVQQSVNREYTRKLSFNGETKTIKEWSAVVGLKPATLQYRKRMGWTDAQVIQTRKYQSPCQYI